MQKSHLVALVAAVLMLALTGPSTAHGPTPQRVSHMVRIAASAEAVWGIVRDPVLLAAWHPMVESARTDGKARGAKRTVVLTSGGSVIDGIDDVNDETMTIRWRLWRENIDVIPVSYYTNDITVTAAGEGATVEWRASFFRADTTNEPEGRYSDDAAVEAMETYVKKGLSGLKKLAETGE